MCNEREGSSAKVKVRPISFAPHHSPYISIGAFMVTTRSRTSGPFEQPHLDSPPPAIRATRSATKAAKEPSAAKHSSSLNHTDEYEFFGPHVPFLLLFVLPAVLYALIFACNSNGCVSLYPMPIKPAPGFPSGSHIFSWEALAAYVGWFFGLVALHLILPGTLAQGTVLKDGSRLQYKLNCEIQTSLPKPLTLSSLSFSHSLYFAYHRIWACPLPLLLCPPPLCHRSRILDLPPLPGSPHCLNHLLHPPFLLPILHIIQDGSDAVGTWL